jgi:hypothetical protein
VEPNQQENTHLSMARGMRIVNEVQVSLCIRQTYEQLRGLRLLVIGVHT